MKGTFDLKEHYSDFLKRAFLATLLFHIFGFMILPREFALNPYKPKVDIPVQLEQLPPPLQNIAEPPPVPKPKVVVESTEEEAEEETIEETDFTGWEREPEAPEMVVPDFVPYDTPPMPTRMVKPEYPAIARQAGIEGKVVLKLLVDLDGKVLDAKVLVSPHQSLSEAAIKAAKSSQFSPALQRDKPVRVWVAQPFDFKLR